MTKTLFILAGLFIMITFYLPVYASDDRNNNSGRLEIKLKPGSETININGENIKVPKPYLSGNNTLVPLRVITESFGAEVLWKGRDRITLNYRDVSIDLTAGNKKCIINQVEEDLPAPAEIVNGTAMAPVRFIAESFGAYVKYDQTTKTVSIILEDDGSLKNFSILTGGIAKTGIGNSYFGWSINIPKGSQVIDSASFNSKNAYILNEQRGMSLEVRVGVSEGKKIDEYYDSINKNPEKLFDDGRKTFDGKMLDASLNSDTKPAFGEFVYNYSDTSALQRIFISKGYIYRVILTSTKERDAKKLKENFFYRNIMDSFKLDFKGGSGDVQDLSRVRDGTVRFKNHISFDDGSNELTNWQMDVLPEWDDLSMRTDPLYTKLGLNNGEYISIYINKADGIDDLEKYGYDMKEFYNVNYNPEYYNFIDKKLTEIAGYKSFNIIYDVKMGGKQYVFDENFIKIGNLLYDGIIKSPTEKYKDNKDSYYKMLNTLKPSTSNTSVLEKGIEAYNIENDKNRMGSDDRTVDYKNRTYGWGFKISGYWTRNAFTDESNQSFFNPHNGAMAGVETFENTALNRILADADRFNSMKSMTSDSDVKYVKKESLSHNGRSVRLYTYRWESADREIFADIKFYIIDGEKYSYCFSTIMPDEFTSEGNMKELDDIWQSLRVES